MTGCYLLHFSRRYKHAGHYLGWAKNIDSRVAKHRKGTSQAKLTIFASNAGIEMELVRTWENADRNQERKLKNSGSLAIHCPLCREGRLARMREVQKNLRESRKAMIVCAS